MFHQLKSKYAAMPLQVKASFWFFLCSFLQKAIHAVMTPIFTRLLTEAEYGQFSVFQSWESILQTFVTLNLFYGVYTSGLVKFKERRNELISALEGLTLILILLWGMAYGFFRQWLSPLLSFSTVQMACMFVILWTVAVYNFWAAEQRVLYRYRKLVIMTLVSSLLLPVLQIVAVRHSEDKVTARICVIALGNLALYSWMFVAHFRRCRQLVSGYFWCYALKFNIPLIPHYLSQSILNSSDRIMIERMVSADAAGIYSLAYSISLIMNMFNNALTQAFSPWVYEKIKFRKEEEISALLLPSILLIAFVNLILIVFAPEVVRIFAPPSYYEAIWTIPPVVMSVYFIYLYDVFSYYEFYYEKTSFIAGATVAAALTNLILNYICIRQFGYIAAGYTTLTCYMLCACGHCVVMRHVAATFLDGNEIVPVKQTLLISVGFMGIGFLFCALYRHPVLRYSAFLAMFGTALIFRRRILDTGLEIMGKIRREDA